MHPANALRGLMHPDNNTPRSTIDPGE